jgi:crotonobetainyl-CoA:carnitine CoA-transferase CaiB-like acyl-CoA transferase
MGLGHLENDERFLNLAARRAHYQELAALIEETTTTRPSEHWYGLLEEAGVPCGVLYRLDQALADEHVQARGLVVELPHSKVGTIRAVGSPMRLSGTPVRADHAGPLLGEHTAEVLAGLGVQEAELQKLAEEGVVILPGAAQ